MNELRIAPLTPEAFAPFGDVITLKESADKRINQGRCQRHHDLAQLDFGPQGRAGISLFNSELCELPLKLDMVERHPDGSQAFIPMSDASFLVVVAEDKDGKPDHLRAFRTGQGQGVNYHRNIWHGVLMPLTGTGLFAVVDRMGDTPNLDEHWFSTQYLVLD